MLVPLHSTCVCVNLFLILLICFFLNIYYFILLIAMGLFDMPPLNIIWSAWLLCIRDIFCSLSVFCKSVWLHPLCNMYMAHDHLYLFQITLSYDISRMSTFIFITWTKLHLILIMLWLHVKQYNSSEVPMLITFSLNYN